jgi:hypothetical protein
MYHTLADEARALHFSERTINSLVDFRRSNTRPLCHAVLARGLTDSYLISLRSVEEILNGWKDTLAIGTFRVDPQWRMETRTVSK